jgi:hypothetical protein
MTPMANQNSSLQPVLDFIATLRGAKIFFRIECHRDEAVMVRVDVPGERWEVEFFADGEMEAEQFVSAGGVIGGAEARRLLTNLIDRHRN